MDDIFNIQPEYTKDNSAEDNTQITTSLLLFYSKEEMEEFKELCRKGMRQEFPSNYKEVGNASDLILKILRRLYGDDVSQKSNL
jgi:hypothetical protein